MDFVWIGCADWWDVFRRWFGVDFGLCVLMVGLFSLAGFVARFVLSVLV